VATTWKYGGYCACGCGQKTKLAPYDHKAHNRRKGEPYEFVFQHHNNGRRSNYVVDERGCHVWQGQPSQRYPSLKIKGRPKHVHVWAWEQAKGAIPQGMVVHHVCGNTRCCNVEHLEIVTAAENAQHASHTRLTMAKAERIRRLAQAGHTYRELAEEYGVSKRSIEAVVYGHTWRPAALHRPAKPPRRND